MSDSLRFAAALFCWAVGLGTGAAFGQNAILTDEPDPNVVPFEVRNVGIEERLGEEVPGDPAFRDHTGNVVTLGRYFDGVRPVVLTLNYARCPKICDTQLRSLAQTAAAMELTAGEDYRLVTVSIDPREGPTISASRRRGYLGEVGRGNWSFLTGSPGSIAAVAAAVGFNYEFDPVRNEYHHAPAAIVLTPDGTISRYLHGLAVDPETLRLSLVEAADGGIGTTADYFPLICYRYDPATGEYVPRTARLAMTATGAVFAVLFGGSLTYFWRRSVRDRPAV